MDSLLSFTELLSEMPVLLFGIGGTAAVIGGALALGIRHGIDWDHIAAITDITSTTSSTATADDVLTREPGVMLTDESHHERDRFGAGHPHQPESLPLYAGERHAVSSQPAHAGAQHTAFAVTGGGTLAATAAGGGSSAIARPRAASFVTEHRQALWLGTLYALGHGTVVMLLGLIAILASEFLPSWIDPIMERVVGITLIFLAAYLFYSLYRFFRGGEFRLRSRWMLIFAGVRNAYRWVIARVHGRLEHQHVEAADQYGARTAYGIGLIHGIGAETGTQVLVIATAVGAGSKGMGVATLLTFVVGLLISNSIVTVLSTAGFVSARRRQGIYVAAGVLAATFSLVLGLVFLFQAGGILPSLGPYFRWIGGPDA